MGLLKVGKDVFFPPPSKMRDFMLGVGEEELNRVYNMGWVHDRLTGGEGFGLTSLQSMSAGIPCVADPEDAAAKFKELYENPDLYDKFSKRAVEKARNEYDWEKAVIPAFDKLLRELVPELRK